MQVQEGLLSHSLQQRDCVHCLHSHAVQGSSCHFCNMTADQTAMFAARSSGRCKQCSINKCKQWPGQLALEPHRPAYCHLLLYTSEDRYASCLLHLRHPTFGRHPCQVAAQAKVCCQTSWHAACWCCLCIAKMLIFARGLSSSVWPHMH